MRDTARSEVQHRAEQSGAAIVRGFLALPYDGIGMYCLVTLARSSSSVAIRARVAPGDFGTGRTFPVGTPVTLVSNRGSLEVLSLGGRGYPPCGGFGGDTFSRVVTDGLGSSDKGYAWTEVYGAYNHAVSVNGNEGVMIIGLDSQHWSGSYWDIDAALPSTYPFTIKVRTKFHGYSDLGYGSTGYFPLCADDPQIFYSMSIALRVQGPEGTRSNAGTPANFAAMEEYSNPNYDWDLSNGLLDQDGDSIMVYDDTWYWIECRFSDHRIDARIWPEGTDPPKFQSYPTKGDYRQGSFGWGVTRAQYIGATAYNYLYMDKIEITCPRSTPLDQPCWVRWDSFKRDPQWAAGWGQSSTPDWPYWDYEHGATWTERFSNNGTYDVDLEYGWLQIGPTWDVNGNGAERQWVNYLGPWPSLPAHLNGWSEADSGTFLEHIPCSFRIRFKPGLEPSAAASNYWIYNSFEISNNFNCSMVSWGGDTYDFTISTSLDVVTTEKFNIDRNAFYYIAGYISDDGNFYAKCWREGDPEPDWQLSIPWEAQWSSFRDYFEIALAGNVPLGLLPYTCKSYIDWVAFCWSPSNILEPAPSWWGS